MLNSSKKKVILITGNLGYIGVELSKYIKKADKNLFLIGFDTGFFLKDSIQKKKIQSKYIDYQIYSDLRDLKQKELKKFNIDTIIHLAAISNDPMGNFFTKPTRQINTIYTKKFINWAITNNVKRFVFASSCSVYGFSSKVCNENSRTNPLTEYARSKLEIEKYLKKKVNKNFKAVSLRFSTACGASKMLRLDLVLNDFVASAISTKEIKLLSDGNALRPLIDVYDMCQTLIWASKLKLKHFLCLNTGNDNMNYKIVELAYLVKKFLPFAKISINHKNFDNRSYKVGFSKLKRLYKGYNKMKNIKYSVKNLIKVLKNNEFNDKNFRKNKLMRLVSLRSQIKKKKLSKNLRILNDQRYYNY